MKYLTMILCLLAASAAGSRDLTLEKALRLAEEHSPDLKEARANLEASGESVSAARAERFPTLSLDARAGYIDDVPSLDIEVPGFVSVTREFGSSDSYQTDLRLTVPIYTGGRISSAIAMAESNREYRQAVEFVSRDRLYLKTRLEYFGLCRAVQMRQAALASLRRTVILQSDIKSRYEAGVADSVDLLEARLARTKAEFGLRRADIDIRSHQVRLLTLLGLPAREPLELTDTLADPEPFLSESNRSGSRPELLASEATIKLKEAQLTGEGAGFYPTLGVYTGYSYGKPNNDPFSGEFNDNFSAGAQLQWSFNLGRKTSAKKNVATHELEAARQRHNDLDEKIRRDIELAWEQMKLAHERHATAQMEHRISLENYRLAQQQHVSGALSANRLLEIEAALSQTEATLIAAKVDFYTAQSAYYYAIGDQRLGKGI